MNFRKDYLCNMSTHINFQIAAFEEFNTSKTLTVNDGGT